MPLDDTSTAVTAVLTRTPSELSCLSGAPNCWKTIMVVNIQGGDAVGWAERTVPLSSDRSVGFVAYLAAREQEEDCRCEECRLLRCYAVWLLQEATFLRNLAPPSSR
jgi:hypothetical protein